MATTREIQQALADLGYDPGPVDGLPGPKTTAAIKAFQAHEGLAIKFPGTVGPKTITALFPTKKSIPEGSSKAVIPPWVEIALAKKGLRENQDHAELIKFLRSDGSSVGDPAKVPWCGDLVSTCIALALPHEPQPSNPYLARNWLRVGSPTDPTLGAIAVFWRGSINGTQGHVTFVVGKAVGALYCLGGNQGDAISIAKISTDRLLGCRWPSTFDRLPLRLPEMSGGALSLNEA